MFLSSKVISVTRWLTFFFVVFLSQNQAYAISCNGTPIEVGVWGNGNSWLGLYFGEFEGPWILCDLSEESGGISQANCQAIYSAVLSSMASGQTLKVKLKDEDYSECEGVEAWDTGLPESIQRVHLAR